MTRRLALLAAASILLSPAWCVAQRPSNKGKSSSSPALTPEPLQLKLGDALSPRALVTRPPLLKGVRSWTMETRRHRGQYSAIDLSPDGKLIATGGTDATVRIWDAGSGKLVKALVAHTLYCYAVAFSPDGKILATGGYEPLVRLWDVKSGMPLRTLKGHGSHAQIVAWSPDGQQIIVAGGASGYVSQFDVTSGKVMNKVDLGRPVRCVAWHPEGKSAALVVMNQPVQLWNLDTGKTSDSFGEANSDFLCAAWPPDGKTLAAGNNTSITLFDEQGKVLHKIDRQGYALAWSADGKRLTASAVNSGKINIIDAASGKPIQEIAGGAYTLNYFPGDRKLLGSDRLNLNMYDIDTGKKSQTYNVAGTTPPWWFVGRPLVTGLGTTTLSLWDPATGKLLRTLGGKQGAVAAFAWSPDGKQLATAGYDAMVRVWDATGGSLVQTFKGHKGVVGSVAWSPEGKQLASGGHDKNVLIWDHAGEKPVHVLSGLPGAAVCVAWSPGNSGIVAGGSGNTLMLWNGKSGKLLHTLSDPGLQALMSVTWTSGGKHVVGAFNDGRVRLWSPASGKLRATHQVTGGYPQLAKYAIPAADASLIMRKGTQTLYLWPVQGNAVVCGPQPMAAHYRSGWTAGSGTLAAVADDRTARMYDAPSGQLRGYYIAEEKQVVAVTIDGHYRADGPGLAELICIAQLEKSHETFSPTQFAAKFKWKNLPANVRLAGR